MIKRILSILLCLALMIGIIPSTTFAASETLDAQTHYDPFTKSKAFESYSYSGLTKNDTKGHFGGGTTGSYVLFKNMDFGTEKGGKVTVYYGLGSNYNGSFDIRTGSADGPVVANIPTTTTQGGWDSEGSKTVDIATPVTGIQDIYVVWNGTAGNFFGIQFDSHYTLITGPNVVWKNAGGNPIGALPLARKFAADASISRNQEETESRKANIALAQYKSTGEMIGFAAGTEQSIINGDTNFAVADQDKLTGATHSVAYLWYDDNTVLNNSFVKGNAPAQPANPVISSSEMNVSITGELIEISGSGLDDARAIVMVIPGKYNDEVLYNLAPTQVWETDITSGKYYYSFPMTSAPSGDYTAIVMSSKMRAPKTMEFSYTNPSEIYSVLQALDNSTDKNDTISILQANAGLFGTQSGLYPNMLSSDKQIIHDKIKGEFSLNPLSSALNADYTPWIGRIKTAIVSDVIMAAVKGSKNLSVIADEVLKYADVMGIDANPKFTKYFKTPLNASADTASVYQNNRTQIIKAMTNSVTDSMVASDFYNLFDVNVVLGIFNAAESWGYVDSALNDFEAEFSALMQADISISQKLANEYKIELMNNFIGKNFTNLSEIEALMNSLIDTYNNPEYFKASKYELEKPDVGGVDMVIDMLHSTVVEESEETTKKSFTDIDGVSWAVSSITYMASMGYVNGKSDTIFAPNDAITREEFAAILVRTFGFDTTNVTPSTFADVDNNAWYAPYVATAAKYGIVNGLENNTFGVGQRITREQIATMLKRTVDVIPQKLLPFKGTIAFADFAYISDWSYSSVMYLARAQIINGTGNDQFSPKKNATRAEAVVMIHRLLQNLI